MNMRMREARRMSVIFSAWWKAHSQTIVSQAGLPAQVEEVDFEELSVHFAAIVRSIVRILQRVLLAHLRSMKRVETCLASQPGTSYPEL